VISKIKIVRGLTVVTEWFGPQVQQAINHEIQMRLIQAADMVDRSTVASMKDSKTGRWYNDKYVGRYQASAPGEAPAIRTTNLMQSLERTPPKPEHKGWAIYYGSDLDYARYLEFGTSKMMPRPFLWPALVKNMPMIRMLFGNNKVFGTVTGVTPARGLDFKALKSRLTSPNIRAFFPRMM
jgi:HK97 gp10 family phage protein